MYICIWMFKFGGIIFLFLVYIMCNGWLFVLIVYVIIILFLSFLFLKEKVLIIGGFRKRNMLKFSIVYEKIKRFI